ncbi:hypothetical protein HYFRA_00001600 [Hymenoscyphus fraxineus]|uniref:Uncharacterized protein n=1 Tax=Hymenoscyphus fraxineus TaxID=746836 RepID=A0A9N9L5X3_9HELO|nr:hypothetical protein HYFRA_00001600 [Hymenoscyphus fraxineus]
MFSMLPPTPAHHAFNLNHTYQFSPVVSSPLSSSPLRSSPTPTPSPRSPRDVNTQAQVYDFNYHPDNNTTEKIMTSPTPLSKPNSSTSKINSRTQHVPHINLPSPPPSRGERERERGKKESVFAKRASKPNPLLHGRREGDEGRETRRKLFLKRVRDGAEEKRWRDRGGDEEIMRVLWMGEERERRRRVEVAIARQVGGEGGLDEEEVDFDEMMAEEVAMIEEAELEARLGDALPRSQESNRVDEFQSPQAFQMDQDQETNFGSDDDEYDHIFMDVARAEEGDSNQQPQDPVYLQFDQDHEMMDMS